jgi:molybdenum ABC transporter molybdate-binding protein
VNQIAALAGMGIGVVVLAACGADEEPGEAAAPRPTTTAAVSGTVTVLAAASLTESFEELGARLAAENPGLDVVFSFGPSSGLVEQVLAGAPADVLATADTRTMEEAVAGGAIEGTPEVFASNMLTLAVPAGNPGEVTGLADLARSELRVVICEPQVPCGAASEKLLSAAGVSAEPDTLTTDVKEATSLVSLGEADAALIYRTDAAAEGDAVETIGVPEAAEVVNEYPVAIVADTPNPAGARLVVAAITGEPGQAIFADAGFLEPLNG